MMQFERAWSFVWGD